MTIGMARCETSLMAKLKCDRKGDQCVVPKYQKYISLGSSTQTTTSGTEHKGVIDVR